MSVESQAARNIAAANGQNTMRESDMLGLPNCVGDGGSKEYARREMASFRRRGAERVNRGHGVWRSIHGCPVGQLTPIRQAIPCRFGRGERPIRRPRARGLGFRCELLRRSRAQIVQGSQDFLTVRGRLHLLEYSSDLALGVDDEGVTGRQLRDQQVVQ